MRRISRRRRCRMTRARARAMITPRTTPTTTPIEPLATTADAPFVSTVEGEGDGSGGEGGGGKGEGGGGEGEGGGGEGGGGGGEGGEGEEGGGVGQVGTEPTTPVRVVAGQEQTALPPRTKTLGPIPWVGSRGREITKEDTKARHPIGAMESLQAWLARTSSAMLE